MQNEENKTQSIDNNQKTDNSSVICQRIAMIDVDKVVGSASSVKKLKEEHSKKNKELERWLKNVKKQIDKPDSEEVKEKLIKRYDAEFAQKKEVIANSFKGKLQAVNADVTAQINEIAKKYHYDIVLSKAVVVLGCDDITNIMIENIK